MKKQFSVMLLALALCLGPAVPALAAEGKDFSQYLTGDLLKKEELTLGGRPFYQISLDDAIKEIPTFDGTGTSTYVAERLGRELTEYNSHLMGRTTYGSTWNYRIVAQQLTGSQTLCGLEYNGGDAVTGELTRFETGIRGIATGDKMADVLETLGVSAKGAALIADEMINGKTNFDLNTGKTFGSSSDNYQSGRPGDAANDMPVVLLNIDDVQLTFYFLGGKLADMRMYVAPNDSAPAFTDVPASEYYAEPVKWAVGKEITNGTTETTFSPAENCTQAQILTFLWRAAGKPDDGIVTPVANINESDYFYHAVCWANDMSMIDPGTFEPNVPCTRSTAVYYICQAFAIPYLSPVDSGFTDVPADADYAYAVSWALENGITNGTTETTFGPNEVCNRGQIVTFLYRAYVPEARLK